MELSHAIAALNAVVLERQHDGRFQRCSKAPRWWHGPIEATEAKQPSLDVQQVFPFLHVFLPEAEQSWTGSGVPIASELWTQTFDGGKEIHLQAYAMRVGSSAALVIVENEFGFADRQLLLQRARELRLTYDALMREIEGKDILLHTIVHDLTAPLHSIVGALSLLRELALPETASRWTQIAVEAAARQRALIRDILDVFVTERGGFQSPSATGVDLEHAIERAIAEREPVARQRQVEMISEVREPYLVVADETRLIRVLTNLLDNAIKHTPMGKRVWLKAAAEDDSVRLTVDDEGPGVSPEVLPRLFQKLVRDPHGGGSGLGLYFCRITIEQWGGGIGYEARATGGASFWIRVRRASDGQAAGTR
jgi:signal transduction histidine kinase